MSLLTFAIIDSEGAYLRNNNHQKRLFVYEVSIVVFVRGKVDYIYTRQLNYDLRHADNQTKDDIRMIPRRFRNPFKRFIYKDHKEDPRVARQQILDIIRKYDCKVFAKGPMMEEVWLYHPIMTTTWRTTVKIQIKNIGELADYNVPKYDNILSTFKSNIIKTINWKLIDHNFSCYEIKNIMSNTNVEDIHYSFFECIVFGTIFNEIASSNSK